MSLHINTIVKHSFFSVVAVLSALILLGSCRDELLGEDGMPQGETTVNIEALFEPFASSGMTGGTTRATGTNDGEVMKDVSDVALLVYDKDGKLMEGYPVELSFTNEDVTDEERTNADATTNLTTDTLTKCLKKNEALTLEFGTYYIVAVANMGSYSKTGTVSKTTYGAFLDSWTRADYDTVDKLRQLKRKWDDSNIYNNRMMMGFFVDKAQPQSPPSSTSDFTPVTINRDGMWLRTWLRRAASKVTVDFDGTDLRENVKIYIRDVKIYDIPKECTAGFGKHQLSDKSYVNYNNAPTGDENFLHSSSQVITIDTVGTDDYTKWPMIAKGSPYIKGADGKRLDLHANNAPSLFFYENMQGNAINGKGPVTDFVQGDVGNDDGLKENIMRYGTYIEVKAYYESEASGNISNGDIIYRFMLGKDADKNCDAERNHHYKVTLKFNGNANAYSWHIDYKEDPDSWDVPKPWYVSYLYNHKSTIPFKYTPPAGMEVVFFEAELVENHWYPDREEGVPFPGDIETSLATNYRKYNDKIGNGFLSLRKVGRIVITPKNCGADSDVWPGYAISGVNIDPLKIKPWDLNTNYFLGNGIDKTNRAIRTYYVNGEADPTNIGDESYTYQQKEQGVSVNVPLFTRAKVLIKETGFSGNNLYVGYTRTAKIKMTPYLRPIGSDWDSEKTKTEGKTGSSEIVEVQQVRRLVNPKGVYRKSKNFEPFHVRLLELPGSTADRFRDFTSDGPWMAEVVGDKNFITLNGKQQVHGSTGEPIDFQIRFNRMNNDAVVRNAVVRVYYNSYTCTHLIFVRQGYEPQAVIPDGEAKDYDHQGGTGNPVKWRTFNRISKDLDADDPRDEGSMFLYGVEDYPIDAINNCYGDPNHTGIGKYNLLPDGDDSSTNSGSYVCTKNNGTLGESQSWQTLTAKVKESGFSSDGDWANMATIRHYEQLYTSPHVQSGYGVLYADGATDTQYEVDKAYGYYRRDPDRKIKGMRGVFLYYWNSDDPSHPSTAKNIFFPIGRSGYGHRKEGVTTWGGNTSEKPLSKGILRYCSTSWAIRHSTFDYSAPIFSDLNTRPGAIYYAQKPETKFLTWTGEENEENGNALGLDVNYYSFDLNAIMHNSLSNSKDACFVRFIAP